MKNGNKLPGIGIGYVSAMLIFVTVSLAVLAALSYASAQTGAFPAEKNRRYMKEYYGADARAKEMLRDIDEAAHLSHEGGFFDFGFEEYLDSVPDISWAKKPGGYSVWYYVSINSRQSVYAELFFYSSLTEGKRFRTDGWQTVFTGSEEDPEGGGFSLWDGN